MNLHKYKDESDNKKNVLRIIYNEKGISRNELVENTGLSLVTITKYVSELITDGIVEEYGVLESTGGRKSSMLRVNPKFAYIIGIDIGSFSIKFGVSYIDGEIIEKEVIPSFFGVPSKGAIFDIIFDKVHYFINKYGNDKMLGIGVGVSGLVKSDEGRIVFCPNISALDGVNIVEILKEEFTLPVFVDTSPRCMALAEQWMGTGKDIKNQIFVSVGYGSIGAGVILDSELFKGSGGFSGELGHVQIDENGIKCTCGNYGCLELYATLFVIEEKIEKNVDQFNGYSPLKQLMAGNDDMNEDMLKEALIKGDKIVYEELMVVGKMIGTAISSMVNVINPELIVLGGGVFENFPILIDVVRQTVFEKTLTPIHQNLVIKRSVLGWEATIKGSSILLIDELLG